MNTCTAPGCDRKARAKGYCYKHYIRLRRTGKLETTRHTGDFWSKVKRGSPQECWPWQGFVKPSGHGLTSIRGLPMHTSRKAWILTHGQITGGRLVLHKCDNALCCNPDHLYLGTYTDNAVDTFTRRPFEERIAGSQVCKLTDEQLGQMWEMRKRGALLRECAERFGVHIQTVMRYVTLVRKRKLEQLREDRLSAPRPKGSQGKLA